MKSKFKSWFQLRKFCSVYCTEFQCWVILILLNLFTNLTNLFEYYCVVKGGKPWDLFAVKIRSIIISSSQHEVQYMNFELLILSAMFGHPFKNLSWEAIFCIKEGLILISEFLKSLSVAVKWVSESDLVLFAGKSKLIKLGGDFFFDKLFMSAEKLSYLLLRTLNWFLHHLKL